MNELEPKYFLFELPLYNKIVINEGNKLQFLTLMQANKSIDAYNPFLKENTTYKINFNPQHTTTRQYPMEIGYFVGVKEFTLECARANTIVNIFISVYIHISGQNPQYILQKVGQSPSIADFHISQIKEYKNVLPQDKLKEFTKAIGLAANGVGIGSFVYLRRIFEYLIEEAHLLAKKDNGWNEQSYEKARIPEKIDLLKHHLPEFLVENKSIYSILSKGVHELDENDCLKHFPAVKVGVELILDEKLEVYIKRKKVEEAKKALQGVAQEMNK